MNAILYLIPISIALGIIALAGFFWTIRSSQYDDPEGDAHRILTDDDRPLSDVEYKLLRQKSK